MDDQELVKACENWQLIAAAIVTVGVAIEFIAGFVAKPAHERIDESHRLETQNATERIANAQERAAKAEKDAAIARIQLERDLEKRAPRRLTEEQKAILITGLRGKIPKINVVVQRDLESTWFALQLEIAFQEAGAKLSEIKMPPGEMMPIPAGIVMYSPQARASGTLSGDPLYETLKKADLFGGDTGTPFLSRELIPNSPTLPLNEYAVYVGQKLP